MSSAWRGETLARHCRTYVDLAATRLALVPKRRRFKDLLFVILLSWVVGYFRIPCRFEAGQKLDVAGIEVFCLIGARRLVVRRELRPFPGQIFSRRFLVIEALLFRHSRKVCRRSTTRSDIKSWNLIRRDEL